ncbi:MAG: hypothetical protein H6686_09545 [Fibrobacteria bacterium]|nr:hypothetical protein [Fibrobacteria bacterium]
MDGVTIEGYREFQAEGDSYLKVARGARKRPKLFTPEIRFNLIAMAAEKHLMAILMHEGLLPEHHTFREMTQAMTHVTPLDPETVALLLKIDAYSDICSLASYKRAIPEEDVMEALLGAAGSLQDLSDALLGPLAAHELARSPS